MARNPLVLFDLDGTLLDVFQYHYESLGFVLDKYWSLQDIDVAKGGYGLPQGEHMRRLCRTCGISESEIARYIDAAQAALTAAIIRTLPDDLRDNLLPGGIALLQRFKEASIPLALVTGTLGPTARVLIERAQLTHYFAAAAYGDESISRVNLILLAAERVGTVHGLNEYNPQLITIGDAPYDIEAGCKVGARTVAVATGPFTKAELRPYSPDVLLDSLAHDALAFAAILGEEVAVLETSKEER